MTDDIAGDPNQIVTGGFASVGRYAVIGHPVEESRSPDLHMAWFRAAQLPGAYEKVDITPDELIRRAPSLPFEFAGINVTMPHKQTILGFVDRVDDDAEAAGAANILYRDEQSAWTAGNTDGVGFLQALEEATGETTMGKDVAIVGAGGAARAIGAALATTGIASLVFINRNVETAQAVASAVGGTAVAELEPNVLQGLEVSVDLVVNTLPPDANLLLAALDIDPLPAHAMVTDINYQNTHPPLLRRADSAGLLTLDGRGMFLWQAAISFERWTGTAPDMDLGRSVLRIPGW